MAGDAEPRRGEVWLVSFGPAIGGEVEETRPAVVVSIDAANVRLNRVQVVPLSSRTDRICPAEAVVRLGELSRKAMADQIATVSKRRPLRRIGMLGSGDLDAVLRVVRIQLGL